MDRIKIDYENFTEKENDTYKMLYASVLCGLIAGGCHRYVVHEMARVETDKAFLLLAKLFKENERTIN